MERYPPLTAYHEEETSYTVEVKDVASTGSSTPLSPPSGEQKPHAHLYTTGDTARKPSPGYPKRSGSAPVRGSVPRSAGHEGR